MGRIVRKWNDDIIAQTDLTVPGTGRSSGMIGFPASSLDSETSNADKHIAIVM